MKNNYISKTIRTFTSVLPVSKKRKGKCLQCGDCCKLPNRCMFLAFKEGKATCNAYMFRPLNCRKYPRSEAEHITKKRCGFLWPEK